MGSAAIFGLGCSSSSPQGTTDSSTAYDAGHITGDLTSPALDAGKAPPFLACPPAPTAPYDASTYVPAVGHQGVCTTADIAAFVAACARSSKPTLGALLSCNRWVVENVNLASLGVSGVDGGSGTACGNCIIAPMNNGAARTDPVGVGQPNYAGCIQLTDPIHGLACAAVWESATACEEEACAYCTDNGTVEDEKACIHVADQTLCQSLVATKNAACADDLVEGGVIDKCSPDDGGAQDNVYITTLICGGAIADAGTDEP
jgi:hypothetical protein